MIFEWFTTVFSEPTEQAKLFTIAISTTLAVALLLMNQWFINNRARKERLIEKLEMLTAAIHGFHTLGLEVNRSLHLNKKHDEKIINKFIGFGIEIDTLCSLYFNKTAIDTGISSDIISLGLDGLNETKLKTGATIPIGHPYLEGVYELSHWFEEAQNKMKSLINKHIK